MACVARQVAVGTPTRAQSFVQASAFAVVTPTRRPVKGPGPVATITRSTSLSDHPDDSMSATRVGMRFRPCPPSSGS